MSHHRKLLLSAGFLVVLVFVPLRTADAICEHCDSIEEVDLWLECLHDNCEDTSCCVEVCNCGGGGVPSSTVDMIINLFDIRSDTRTLDFSTPLPDASGLSVSWTGTATQGLAEICDSSNNCRVEPYDAQVGVRLQNDAGEWPAGIVISTFDPGLPTTRSLYPLDGPEVWDPLRDGVVDVRFDMFPPPTGTGETATVLTPATADLELHWTALSGSTPVPALSSWGVALLATLLLLAGVTVVAHRKPVVDGKRSHQGVAMNTRYDSARNSTIASARWLAVTIGVLAATTLGATTAAAVLVTAGGIATVSPPPGDSFGLSIQIPGPQGTMEIQDVDAMSSTLMTTTILFDPSGDGTYEYDVAYRSTSGLVDIESLLPGLNLVGQLGGDGTDPSTWIRVQMPIAGNGTMWSLNDGEGTVITLDFDGPTVFVENSSGSFSASAPQPSLEHPADIVVQNGNPLPAAVLDYAIVLPTASGTVDRPNSPSISTRLEAIDPHGVIEIRDVDMLGTSLMTTTLTFDPSGDGSYEVDASYLSDEMGEVDIESLFPGLGFTGQLGGDSKWVSEHTAVGKSKVIWSWPDGTVITIDHSPPTVAVETTVGSFVASAPTPVMDDPTAIVVQNDTPSPVQFAARAPTSCQQVHNADGCAPSPFEELTLEFEGVVYVTPGTYNAGSVHIQGTQSGGLTFFDPNAQVAEGDLISLTGTVGQFNGNIELQSTTISRNVAGAPLAATPMQTGDLAAGADLIGSFGQVEGILTKTSPDGCTNCSYEIDDGSGPATVYVDETSGIDIGRMDSMLDEEVLITGATMCFNGLREILPRHDTDVRAATVVHHGIIHHPLGLATLEVVGDELIVSNIGSSGEDGVDLELGGGAGAGLGWVPLPDPTGAPDGFFLQCESDGDVNGVPGVIGTTSVEVQGGGVILVGDFNAYGSPTHRVEFYLAGVHVATSEGQMGASVTTDVLPVGCEVGEWLPRPFPYPYPTPLPGPAGPWLPVPGFAWTWETATTFDTSVGAVVADEVRVLPEGAEDGDPDAEVQDVAFHLSEWGEQDWRVDAGDFLYWRTAHTGLGNAILRGEAGTLHIDNIGASGDDGVRAELSPTDIEFEAHLQPFSPAVPGQALTLHAEGTVGGVPQTPLGSLELAAVGGALQLTPDYSPIGSFTQTLQLYDQGQLVAEQLGSTDPAIVLTLTMPTSCGKTFPNLLPPPILCFYWRWPQPVDFDVVGLGIVQADEIRVLAEDPSAVVEGIEAIALTGTDVPEIVMTGERNGIRNPAGAGWTEARGLGAAKLTSLSGLSGFLTLEANGTDILYQDGVVLDLEDGLTEFGSYFVPLGDADAVPDGSLDIAAFGELVGDPASRYLGGVSIQTDPGAGRLLVSTDYAPVGSFSVRLRVFDDGAVVLDEVMPDGLVVGIPDWPVGCGIEPASGAGVPGPGTLDFWLDVPDDTLIEPLGGSSEQGSNKMAVPADVIKLIAEAGAGPPQKLDHWQLKFDHVPVASRSQSSADWFVAMGSGQLSPVSAPDRPTPGRIVLHAAAPNPFNPRTLIHFDLPRRTRARLQIFDVRGRLVTTLRDELLGPGTIEVPWNGMDASGKAVSSGVYHIRLSTTEGTYSQKATLLK